MKRVLNKLISIQKFLDVFNDKIFSANSTPAVVIACPYRYEMFLMVNKPEPFSGKFTPSFTIYGLPSHSREFSPGIEAGRGGGGGSYYQA